MVKIHRIIWLIQRNNICHLRLSGNTTSVRDMLHMCISGLTMKPIVSEIVHYYRQAQLQSPLKPLWFCCFQFQLQVTERAFFSWLPLCSSVLSYGKCIINDLPICQFELCLIRLQLVSINQALYYPPGCLHVIFIFSKQIVMMLFSAAFNIWVNFVL